MYNHSAMLPDTLHFYNKNYIIHCKETRRLQRKSEIIVEMITFVVLWAIRNVDKHFLIIKPTRCTNCRSQWSRGLRLRSAASRLLRSWIRIPPGAWMFVCCECCVLSGRGLCDELITRPEESYRLWCVVVCDLETSRMRRP